MLYELLQALVYEERWYLRHADTVSCLTSDAETWNFARQSADQNTDNQVSPNDSSRLRVFHYYEEESLGGTTDDKDALRRFGRICFVISRRQNDSILPMQINQIFHLAIHCAEVTEDHALAYRAYDKFPKHGSPRILPAPGIGTLPPVARPAALAADDAQRVWLHRTSLLSLRPALLRLPGTNHYPCSPTS